MPVERDGSRSSSGSVTTSSSSRHTPTTTPLPTPDHPPSSDHAYGGGGGGVSLGSGTSPSNISAPFSQHSHANHHRLLFMPHHKKPPLSHPHNHSSLDKLSSEADYQQSKPGSYPGSGPLDHDKIEGIGGDTYSYVEFVDRPPPHHEYHYPVIEPKREKRDSIASLKKELVAETPAPQLPPLLPEKKNRFLKNKRSKKVRCRYCNDTFTDDTNPRGSCKYAPDYVRSTIDALTCICCAQCMLYHCMSDAEGDFAHHPCECGGAGVPDQSCGKRWLGLTLLSLLVPCLWCYLPLKSCHKCAIACGLCGGKHQAS